jgi:hypothetical protein
LGDIDWNRIFAEGTVDGDDLHSGLRRSLTEEKQAPISFQIQNSASAREREEERRTSSRTVVVWGGGGGGEELGSEKRMWEMNEWLSGKWGSATPIWPDEGGLATPKVRRPPQIFSFVFFFK